MNVLVRSERVYVLWCLILHVVVMVFWYPWFADSSLFRMV